MLVLTKENVTDNIIVTLNEKRTLAAPNYLFVFEHVTTKDQVKTILFSGDDLSSYPDRFNEFEIPTSVLFADESPGQFNYFIYEQVSAVNLDPAGLTEVEMGKMVLKTTAFNYTGYEATTSYKGYNG